MQSYALLGLSVLFALANNLIVRASRARGLTRIQDVLLFNALVSFLWAAALLTYGGIPVSVTRETRFWACLYGVCTAGFLLCKMMTLSTGPLSLSTLIGCCALLIQAFGGALLWREAISGLQLVGVGALVAGLVLCVGLERNSRRITARWVGWVTAFFFISGALGLLFKAHQKSVGRDEINELMLIGSLISGTLLLGCAYLLAASRRESMPRVQGRAVPWLLAAAATSLLYNRINIYLSGVLPSVVFFPIFNGCVIVGATALGGLVFRERLKVLQIAGILLGLFALLLIGNIIS